MSKNKKIDYSLPFKQLFYAHYFEDADMYCRAKEQIAVNNTVSRTKNLVALRKIKREVAVATKNKEVSALYEKWSKEWSE